MWSPPSSQQSQHSWAGSPGTEYHGSRTQYYDRVPQFSLWGTQQYGKGPQSREPEAWEDPQLKGQGVWGDPEPPEEWEPDPHPHDPENQFDIRDILWDGWNPRGVQDQLPKRDV